MKKKSKIKKKSRGWMFWLPRAFSITFIAFISIFALDIFDMNLGFWGTILGLFMHLLPSIFLLALLLASWRKNGWIAGCAFFLFGIWYLAVMRNPLPITILIFTGISWFIGALFFIDWWKSGQKP